MNNSIKNHPVDQVPAPAKLTVLSLQHVLAFYAGAVIVPLLIASSLNLDQATTIHLINADLFTCGIATLIQSVGLGKKIGVRLPIIQGVTTTAVAPIIAIGLATTNGEGGLAGLPYIYGAIIFAGLFTFFSAPYFAKLLRFFPPVVTGTVLLVMGTSLLSVSANDFVNYAEKTPDPLWLAYGFGTLAVIVLAQRFFKGFLGTIAVLIGLIGGTAVATFAGHLDTAKVEAIQTSDFIGITTPFFFGIPAFTFTGVISMAIVMIITMVETTGDVFATGEIVDKRITQKDVTAAIRADGLSTLLGGILNSFPYTCFAQNVGLVRITQVKSRWVAAGAGIIMIFIGLIPKAGALVAAIPASVLGGASLALFANVAWVGLQTIAKADMKSSRNAVIVTTSLGLAMLVTFKPNIAQVFPAWAQIFFSSGMTIGAICAITLNLLFFHLGKQSEPVSKSVSGEVSIDDINKMEKEEFISTFRNVFNNQTWPLAQVWEARPFVDALALRSAIQEAVLTAETSAQHDLIRDYPDMYQLLSASTAEAAKISQDIGSLALESATAEELSQLANIAQQYQQKFGFPWVAYLGIYDTPEQIINDGIHRLENSQSRERIALLSEIIDIANDRFDRIVADANPIIASWESKYGK